jgi:hypothetical protein
LMEACQSADKRMRIRRMGTNTKVPVSGLSGTD